MSAAACHARTADLRVETELHGFPYAGSDRVVRYAQSLWFAGVERDLDHDFITTIRTIICREPECTRGDQYKR